MTLPFSQTYYLGEKHQLISPVSLRTKKFYNNWHQDADNSDFGETYEASNVVNETDATMTPNDVVMSTKDDATASDETFDENLRQILDGESSAAPNADSVTDANLSLLSELENDIGLPPGVLSDPVSQQETFQPSDDIPFWTKNLLSHNNLHFFSQHRIVSATDDVVTTFQIMFFVAILFLNRI